jgi:hypothetical protein
VRDEDVAQTRQRLLGLRAESARDLARLIEAFVFR